MRDEVIDAVVKSNSLMEWALHFQEENPEGSYEAQAQELVDKNEKLLDVTREKLTNCLYSRSTHVLFSIRSSTSIAVFMDQAPEHQVIIEITPYGSLCAVFSYGFMVNQLLHWVESCIQECHLIQLTQDEIEELQRTSQYYHLF